MIIICEKCNTGYELDASQIGERGRMVKCTSCYHVWRQFLPQDELLKRTKSVEQEKLEETEFKKRISSSVPMNTSSPQAYNNKPLKNAFALLLILNLLIIPLAFYDSLFTKMPFLQPLADIANSYSTSGLAFSDVKFDKIKNDDKVSLLINGEIVNNSKQVKHLPSVTITFVNSSGRKVLAHKYPIDKKFINPGEHIPFEPKISDVPAERVAAIYLDIGNSFELLGR